MSHIAIVTGSTRGIGKAIALELGRAGWTVFVTGRSTRDHPDPEGIGGTVEETVEAVEAEGDTGIAVAPDQTQVADIDRLASQVADGRKHLDLLVNNAWGGYERYDVAAFTRPFW